MAGRNTPFIKTTLLLLSCCLLFAGKTATIAAFAVKIHHITGATGNLSIYTLNQYGIIVSQDCDFSDCIRTVVYSRRFSRTESNRLYLFLRSLQLDTLKSHYAPDYTIVDGLVSTVKIDGALLPTRSTEANNIAVPVLKLLFSRVDQLIAEKKYRYFDH